MKKLLAISFIGLFLLVSCGGNNNTQIKTPKVEIQSKTTKEPTKIEISSGSTNFDNSGITTTASGEISDSGSDEALKEIDKIINDISKEK